MKVLITGIDGFIASHLAEYLVNNESDVEIYGTYRRGADRKNIAGIEDRIKFVEMELTDPYSVQNAIKEVMPDKVFHLAGQTFVPTSWVAPTTTVAVNVDGTVNLLESIKELCPKAFVQVAGSSEEYGLVHAEECPIKETHPLRPLSPYGVSKVATDYFGYQYAKSHNMNILRTRTFNQTGPRRGDVFVDSNFAKQIAMMERYLPEKREIFVGNLDAIRDFTDVRDTVRAYWALSERTWHGEVVNVCSGNGKSIKQVLQKLINYSTICDSIKVIDDPSRMRPSDVPLLIGDNTLLKCYIDWEPMYRWEDSLLDLLEYWRDEYPSEPPKLPSSTSNTYTITYPQPNTGTVTYPHTGGYRTTNASE